MLSVADAYRQVLARARPLAPRPTPLAAALGLILAEPVVADGDSPPFDKALVDGFAVRSADLDGPDERALELVEEILAGQIPRRALQPGQAAAIMTGAPLPPGADAVVMVEESRRPAATTVALRGPVRPGQNRLLRGREMKAGEAVLEPGTLLNAARIGLLGSVGRATVTAIPRPVVAVVTTGDELVPVDRLPGPGQIRNSNAAMLAALAASAGGDVRSPGPIAPDEPAALRRCLELALGGDDADPRPADLLIISGGVSAGTKDLVPAALEAVGITPIFHKVRLRPGKPLWFGAGRAGGPLVFGLPGNPVSGLVGHQLFARPAIAALAGRAVPAEGPDLRPATLATAFDHRGDRPTLHPARVVAGPADRPTIEPLPWAGSPDLRAVGRADGFASFAAGDRSYAAGEAIEFLPLDA